MTAECLAKIEQLNRKGLNDAIIAERLYCSKSAVHTWRNRLGLPVVGINRSKKRYAIYDGKTTQFIMEGSSRECAARMGIKMDSFRSVKRRFEKGTYKKYEIYDVKEGDTDADHYDGS